MKALLIYSSHDGQTYKIMKAIAEKVNGELDYDLVNLAEQPNVNLDAYEAICFGAPIRYGYFNKQVKQFIHENAEKLNNKKSAFYSVTLTARKEGKNTPQTNNYTRKFLAKITWQPKLAAAFAGALHYPEYRWFDRVMIQLIMKISGGVTDATQDIEYTDWQKVDTFADEFIALAKQ